MNRLNDEKGLTLVEILVGLGVASLVGLGVASQMKSISIGNARVQKKLEIDSFLDNVARTLMKKEVCDANFMGRDLSVMGADVPQLVRSGGPTPEVLIAKGADYLAGAVTIENIAVRTIGVSSPTDKTQQFELKITARKNKERKAYNLVTRNIMISADITGALVESCYFKMTDVTGIDDVCRGEGVIRDTDPATGQQTCFHKRIETDDTVSKSCPPGLVLKNVTYDADAFEYKTECGEVFSMASTCTSGRIKSIDANGEFACFGEAEIDNLINTGSVNFVTGGQYKLTVSGNKIKLE